MKRWMTLLLGCLLLCTACGKKELLGSIALREDTNPEQMIEELSQRYDLPESMLLESAADLAALLQIKEKVPAVGLWAYCSPGGQPTANTIGAGGPGQNGKGDCHPAKASGDSTAGISRVSFGADRAGHYSRGLCSFGHRHRR